MARLSAEDKKLMASTRPFAEEDPLRSTYYTLSSHALFLLCSISSVFVPYLALKIVLSITAGLLLLRCFVIYHDYLHGSILRKAKWASPFFRVFSVAYLTPKAVWRETHNYHHAHCSKILTSHIGSYKVVTVESWKRMGAGKRAYYRFLRHPLNMLLGTVTVFLLGMMIAPMFRNFRKNIDALFVLVAYIVLSAALIYVSVSTFLLALFIPQSIAGMLGAYLFYAQHNFPTADIKAAEDWNYVHAALHSSSFMKMNPIMHWFSANIGYHHIHHLNARIPFYRLPEAMAAIPELAPQHVTSLSFSDIRKCLSLKVWDSKQKRLVAYPQRP